MCAALTLTFINEDCPGTDGPNGPRFSSGEKDEKDLKKLPCVCLGVAAGAMSVRCGLHLLCLE